MGAGFRRGHIYKTLRKSHYRVAGQPQGKAFAIRGPRGAHSPRLNREPSRIGPCVSNTNHIPLHPLGAGSSAAFLRWRAP